MGFEPLLEALELEHSYAVYCAGAERGKWRQPTRRDWALWSWWAQQLEWVVDLHEEYALKVEGRIYPF